MFAVLAGWLGIACCVSEGIRLGEIVRMGYVFDDDKCGYVGGRNVYKILGERSPRKKPHWVFMFYLEICYDM